MRTSSLARARTHAHSPPTHDVSDVAKRMMLPFPDIESWKISDTSKDFNKNGVCVRARVRARACVCVWSSVSWEIARSRAHTHTHTHTHTHVQG